LETKRAKVVVLGPWWLALSLVEKTGEKCLKQTTKPSQVLHHFLFIIFALISFSYSLWLPSRIAFASSNTI
jgi:hypothetical protein